MEVDFQIIFIFSVLLCSITATSKYDFWGLKKFWIEFKTNQVKYNKFVGHL